MLPAIPVMLKTAATSIAKQAAVDAASGALSSSAKNKLSKVTKPNSETQRLEREFSKNFKELEEVDTSDGLLQIQDSFNSKLDSILSTSDEKTSALINAVKDSNKATAEMINSNLGNLREDMTVLAENVTAVNANVEAVGQMSTLAAEASAQGIGTSSNLISDIVSSIKDFLKTLIGGSFLTIGSMFNSISRKLNKTESEEGGDTTGMSGLNIEGDEELTRLSEEMSNAYDEMKAAERINVSNSEEYAIQFRKEGVINSPKESIQAFKSPEKLIEKYNKGKSFNDQISISDNSEENFVNLVKVNRNLTSKDKGYIPFNDKILKASDEELRTYYKEYNLVKDSNSIDTKKRKQDYEAKKAEFEKATEAKRKYTSEKIREKVLELASTKDKSGEEVINELMVDKNGNRVQASFADVISYYSTDKGRKSNTYNLSDETITRLEELSSKLVKGLKSYIDSDSISEATEGTVTTSSPDSTYLKYVVSLGGDLNNSSFFGNTQDEKDIKAVSQLAFEGKVGLANSEGKSDTESIGMGEYETYNDAIVKGVDKFDDVYAFPIDGYIPTDEEKAALENYNGIPYEDLISKLEEINKNVTNTGAMNFAATSKAAEITTQAIANSSDKNSQSFISSNSRDVSMDGVQ